MLRSPSPCRHAGSSAASNQSVRRSTVLGVHDLGTVSTKQELSRSSWSKREEALLIDLERKERALQQASP